MKSQHEPCFAVVGHPNKGKSSIVATLARDDSIAIARQSGTTTAAASYRYENAGGHYCLVDTPGFQRPHAVLAWLRQQESGAHRRAETVARFVEDPDCQQRFPDETALLRPLVAGAAILYVVDGSVPYSPEYEAEMEILRWSGRPSMGLINPIDGDGHVQAWQQALQQYFRVVQRFDPMEPRLDAQARLLQTFALLQPEWETSLQAIADALLLEAQGTRQQAARILARWLGEATALRHCQQAVDRDLAESLRPVVQARYRQQLVAAEQQVFQQLLAVFRFRQTAMEGEALHWPGELLDATEWKLWGLNRNQLYTAAATAGAGTGALVDMALLGHSFMMGALVGGLAGLGSAWWGAGRLENLRMSALAGGRWEVCAGPIRDRNFPFVLLARFGWLYRQLSHRTHARRGSIPIQTPDWARVLEALPGNERKALFEACEKLSRQKTVDQLHDLLMPVLQAFAQWEPEGSKRD